ncbi:MAG: phospho-N-acetylmuramoyl-pentapeptide-transferase [Armatimonadota bacterium]|jgi:phospho-N-acetylmuramoyl-pentapeptide-transferase
MTVELLIAWICLVGGCALSAALTGALLPSLRRANVRQHVRDDGPESHLAKAGTPSMGGLAIHATLLIFAGIIAVGMGGLSGKTWAVLAFIVGMALVGFGDDFEKLRRKTHYGVGARFRLLLEFLFAGLLVWYLGGHEPEGLVSGLTVASLASASWLWKVAAAVVVVGAANAVNLTDGLDGLSGGLTALCGVGLAFGCWVTGEMELALLALAVSGASAGFLWQNAPPAKVFMGDVGSIGLGAALGAIAIAARIELLLALVGLVFVVETLSVIVQVVSYQTTGKRVLRMSPLHHHFELVGWEETTIVVRAWLIGAGLAATGVIYAAALVM